MEKARGRYARFRTRLPPAYVRFMESHDGWEGDMGDRLGYAALWNPALIDEYWSDCEMEQYLSDNWFPFGSNGGGEMFCFDLHSGSDAVYYIPFIGMADEEAMLHCESFSEMIAQISD